MIRKVHRSLWNTFVEWMGRDRPAADDPLCDYSRIAFESRIGDVILVEGRSRVSDVIRLVTYSPWTHAALYIGRINDIADPALRQRVSEHYDGDPHQQLIVEALLGRGTIVEPMEKYRDFHLRICRPEGLSARDAQRVVSYAVHQLGRDYDVRQILDLLRFLFPWSVLPRRWRSSLFQHNAGTPTRTVCSSMIARAFMEVEFPVLPVARREKDGWRLYRRNFRLFTPRDFDHSPYFQIIKYPFLGDEDRTFYRSLPWDEQGMICDSPDECYLPDVDVAGIKEREASTGEPATDSAGHPPLITEQPTNPGREN